MTSDYGSYHVWRGIGRSLADRYAAPASDDSEPFPDLMRRLREKDSRETRRR